MPMVFVLRYRSKGMESERLKVPTSSDFAIYVKKAYCLMIPSFPISGQPKNGSILNVNT
jgi:hypothetical protein